MDERRAVFIFLAGTMRNRTFKQKTIISAYYSGVNVSLS